MLIVLVFLLFLTMFFMMCSSILIGLIGAVFLHTSFEDSVSAAWHRPLFLLLFTVVFIPVLAATRPGLYRDINRFNVR